MLHFLHGCRYAVHVPVRRKVVSVSAIGVRLCWPGERKQKQIPLCSKVYDYCGRHSSHALVLHLLTHARTYATPWRTHPLAYTNKQVVIHAHTYHARTYHTHRMAGCTCMICMTIWPSPLLFCEIKTRCAQCSA